MLSEHRGHHCQHRSDDFADIAAILTPHRPRIVVELGTDRGGFAAFLADLVAPWCGQVVTFDLEPKFQPSLLRDFPNLCFVQADVLTDVHAEVVSLVSRENAFLYCDNGNKRREMELYAPLLHVGSVLGVHDYNTEIMAEWVEPFVAALGYEPEGHARMEALRNEWYPEPMSRFWVRRRIQEPAPKTACELPIDPEPFETDAERAWFLPDEPAPVPPLPTIGRGRAARRRSGR